MRNIRFMFSKCIISHLLDDVNLPLDFFNYFHIHCNRFNCIVFICKTEGRFKMSEDIKDEILTIEQCAQLLKISPRTVYDLVSAERQPGKIFAKKVGRSWRILRREVERYMSEEPGTAYQMAFNPNSKQ